MMLFYVADYHFIVAAVSNMEAEHFTVFTVVNEEAL